MEMARPRRAAWELECNSLESGLSQSLRLLGAQPGRLEDMSRLVPIVLKYLKDPRPRVRWAAADVIRVLSVWSAPAFQWQYYNVVLPALIDLMEDQNLIVRRYAMVAVGVFSRDCAPAILELFFHRIWARTYRIGEIADDDSKVAALGALALAASATSATSATSAVKDRFYWHYGRSVVQVKIVLDRETDASKRFLRANCLECISYMAVAIGKDAFLNDKGGGEVMEALILLQGSLWETDHLIKIHFLQASINFCICLGQDFFIYARHLMPLLIQSARINVSVVESFSIHALQEKALACEMLSCCASQLKEKFFPWTDKVAEILVPLLDFNLHFETRVAAISAMPALLHSATLAVQKGQSEGKSLPDIQYLADMIITALIKALKGNDKDVSARVLKSLYGCMKVSGSLFNEAQLRSIVDGIQIDDLAPFKEQGSYETGNDSTATESSDPCSEAPLAPIVPQEKDIVEYILDEQIVSTRHGGYQKFLVKWKNRPNSKSTWITKEDLQCIDPDILEQYYSFISQESGSSQLGGIDGYITEKHFKVHQRRKKRRAKFTYR